MNTALKTVLFAIVIGSLLGFPGCSKKADQNKPITAVQAEADKMNVEQLKAKAMEYKNAIVAKKAEIDKVVAKLKEIPVTEQMGTEAKALQADMQNLSKAVNALTERFQVYYNKLKEKGGNVSGLEI
jgi:outer membrane murein-binding lipoprotein Lpp